MKSNWIKYVFIIFIVFILIFAVYKIKEEEQNNQVDRSSTNPKERRHDSKENTDQYTNNCTVDFIGLDFCLINGIDQSSKCNNQKA